MQVSVGKKKRVEIHDATGKILIIDATTNEEHVRTSQATVHEIEGGDTIADHVVKKGAQLTLTGVISEDAYIEDTHEINTDVETGPDVWTGERLQRIGAGAFSGIVGSLAGGGVKGAIVTGATSKLAGSLLEKRRTVGDQISPDQEVTLTKVRAAFQVFEQIYDNKIPVQIITGLVAYDNACWMIMESLSIPRNVGTFRSLSFTATFRKIVIISNETIKAPVMADKSTANRGTPQKKMGNISTIDPGGKTKSKGSTLAFKITGGLGLHH